MKTKKILDKYKKLISEILLCKEDAIKFYMNGEEIGSIDYEKAEEYGAEAATLDWGLGNFHVMYDPANSIGKYFGTKEENSSDHLNFCHYDKIISTFKLYEMPHCCAYIISCNVIVNKNYTKKGIGTILNLLRLDIGRLLGYSAMLCTDIEKNKGQRKILAKNEWRDIHDIINKRTKNKVFLSVKNL